MALSSCSLLGVVHLLVSKCAVDCARSVNVVAKCGLGHMVVGYIKQRS